MTDASRKIQNNIFQRLSRMLALFGCLPSVLALGARWWWPLELATHFRVQYLCLLIPLVALLLYQNQYRLAAIPILILTLNAAYVLPLYLSQSQPASGKTRVRAISANVYTSNRNHTAFTNFIEKETPDFFLMMEANQRWIDQLEVLQEDYPHSLVEPRSDNFGIAIYSRIPFEYTELIKLADSQVPTLVIKLNIEGQSLTVIGTHPLPPVNAEYVGYRNRQVAALGRLVAETPGPVIVLGDLNMTSWSPHFQDLLKQSELRDSRQGFGVHATWPDHRRLLFIPIDHALVSPEIAVHDRRVGESIGSDHRPIILDFSVSPEADQNR